MVSVWIVCIIKKKIQLGDMIAKAHLCFNECLEMYGTVCYIPKRTRGLMLIKLCGNPLAGGSQYNSVWGQCQCHY